MTHCRDVNDAQSYTRDAAQRRHQHTHTPLVHHPLVYHPLVHTLGPGGLGTDLGVAEPAYVELTTPDEDGARGRTTCQRLGIGG